MLFVSKAASIFNVPRMHSSLCDVYFFFLINKMFTVLEITTFSCLLSDGVLHSDHMMVHFHSEVTTVMF